MITVIGLWGLSIVAGLCWPRWVVAMSTGAVVVAWEWLQPQLLSQPVGWFQLATLGMTPWLLAAQQAIHTKRTKRLQATEAVRMTRLQELARSYLHLQASNQRLESQIAQITDLYHVTKETSRALRLEELFDFFVEIAPRTVDVQGLRLIDLSEVATPPRIFRARQTPDGQFLTEAASQLLPFEGAIVERTTHSGLASVADGAQLGCEWPAGLSHVAWVPLWGEQQPIGVLIADALPKEQLGILSIVANQLSLQLARIHLYQTVQAMAITDTLTGLFVRRYFLELAGEELLRSTRHGLPCTVIMADLDLFKTKNDTYGHLVGDVILRDVAQVLLRNLREVDLIARYGGEEFILLLIETGPEQALPIAERLRQLVEVHAIRAYDEALNQTVSMGLACFPEDGQTLQELIDRSDQALYAAKRAGRNHVVRWSEQLKLTTRFKTLERR